MIHLRRRLGAAFSLGVVALMAALVPPHIASGQAPPAAKTAAALPFTNPVIDRDLPDPAVIEADGAYWMTHTTGGPDVGWPLYQSFDLVHWEFKTHLLTKENKPEWMQFNFWAPEIHRVATAPASGRYVLTFTAHDKNSNRLCIGMATAPRIGGPYTVQRAPIVSDSVTVLDSHIFQDGGRNYLLWKRDSPEGKGIGGTIVIQALDATGTAFAPGSEPVVALTGEAKGKEGTDPSLAWERGLVEAPWIIKHGGYYYLFYSAAFIDASYAMGVARATSPTGPYVRCPGNPILRSNAKWAGPGHGGFIQDRAGVEWHLYHSRYREKPDFGRVQLLDRLYWNGAWPAFGTGGTPSIEEQPAPDVRPKAPRTTR